jgi:hypothetical protein
MVVAMLLMGLIMIGMVMNGARDQDLTVQRMSTLRSFYATEAGLNMGIRELVVQVDADGDGVIGSISNDGNSSNNPMFSGAGVFVTASQNGSQWTLIGNGSRGETTRKASTIMDVNAVFGNPSPPPYWSMWNAKDKQIASPVVLSESGTLTSLSAVVWGASAQLMRLAIYTDGGGKPGTLIAQSANEPIGNGHGEWRKLAVPSTPLTPGTYWLALCTNTNSVSYYFATPGVTHIRNYDAVANGYLSPWGTSDSTRDEKLAIIGTYTPSSGGGNASAILGWQEIP